MSLQRADNNSTVMGPTNLDDDGYFALSYKHRGRPTDYQIEWSNNGNTHTTAPFPLQANGWVEVDLEAVDNCVNPSPSNWLEIDPQYGSGKFKNQ